MHGKTGDVEADLGNGAIHVFNNQENTGNVEPPCIVEINQV